MIKSNIIKYIAIAVFMIYSFFPGAKLCGAANTSPSVFFDVSQYVNELQKMADEISPAVVMAVFYDIAGEEVGHGSGFFIDSEGRIMINASNTEDAYSAEVFSEKEHYESVKILNHDKDLDLALIKVDATGEVFLEFDYSYDTVPGKKVVIIGKSRSQEKTVSKGTIHEVTETSNEFGLIKIKTSESISLLSSKDGPLLNMEGKVIGVATKKSLDSLMFGLDALTINSNKIEAVSLGAVKSFLSVPVKAEQLKPSKTRVWTKYLIMRVQKITGDGFVILYDIGLSEIINKALLIVIVVGLLLFYLKKIIKRFTEKNV